MNSAFRLRHFTRIGASSRFYVLLILALMPAPAFAQDPGREQVLELVREHMERIGGKMREADLMMSGANELKLQELKSGAVIPDGEPLILRSIAGKDKLVLAQEIDAVKQGGQLLVSLGDFCTALEFPVTVDPAQGTASGWFIRENRTFQLDAAKYAAVVEGAPAAIAPADILVTAEDILISSALLEKWFGVDIAIDLQGLSLHFIASAPLPIELKEKRKKLPRYAADSTEIARLPLKEQPYSVFSAPYLDITAGISSSRPDGNSPTSRAATWSALGSGDMMGLNTRVFANGNWKSQGNGDALSALRLTFGKEDPDGGVFGLPQARYVEFGDVNTVNLSLTGGTVQEQGVYASNQIPGNYTTASRIDIRGDWQPGWDVELYNNDSLLGIQTVTEDGRYNFEQVFLFEGENVMKLVFYGPQGEIREEERRIVSRASTLDAGDSKWETSLTRENITTYNAQKADTPIDGDIRMVARYEHSFGPQTSVNIGATHRSELDVVGKENKDYVQAGVATNFLGALLTADAAYDVDGEYVADALARYTFGQHQTGLRLLHSSGEFPQGSLASFAPENLVEGNIRGPFADEFLGIKNITYSGNAAYSTNSDGSNAFTASGSLNGRTDKLGISTALAYSRGESGGITSPVDGRMSGSTTVSGWAGKGRWRVQSSYGLQPAEAKTLTALYSYPFTKTLQGTAQVTHQHDTSLTGLELSARWRHDKFTLLPRIEVDTDEQLTMGLNVNFSLADDPYGEGYNMYGRSLADGGGVSARVFFDRNGDGIFGANDELLPEVDIRAMQAGGKATTNENGVAFLPSLHRGMRTDIVVQPETLPDPYQTPSVEGYSTRPRPGVTSPLDFPVVMTGELDGQVGFAGGAPTGRMQVKLMTPEGTVSQSAAIDSDGYYSFSSIRPGLYYLTAEGAAGSAPPRIMAFGPEGANYFGENIIMMPGDKAKFIFSAANNSPAVKTPGRIVRQADIAGRSIVIHVGEYRSRLAYAFAKYRFLLMSGPWDGAFEQIETPPPPPHTENGEVMSAITLKPVRTVTMADAVNVCNALQERSYKCTIEIITRYHDPAPEVPPAPPVLPQKTASVEQPAESEKAPEGDSPKP